MGLFKTQGRVTDSATDLPEALIVLWPINSHTLLVKIRNKKHWSATNSTADIKML